MKKIFFLLILFIQTFSLATAGKEITLKAGDILIYDVKNYNLEYEFKVTLKELSKQIVFDWEMGSPMNLKGSVTITAKSLKDAVGYDNYFKEGSKELTDKSSVFITDKNYKELIKGKTYMDMGDGCTGNWITDETDAEVQYKGGTMNFPAYYLTLDRPYQDFNGIRDLRVLKTSKYHLIHSMNLGWTIYLKEIQ